jgi:NarL family two-component system sensor histidine kinase LiaS
MLKRFQGLRWKLTLSYTVVTVATLLVVELLLVVGIGAIVLNSNLLPGVLIYATETFITPQVASYLDRPQPDIDSLMNWLESAFVEGLTFQSSQNPKVIFRLGDFEEDTTLAILDRNLIPLARFPESIDHFDYEASMDLLKAAQAGEDDPDRIARTANGYLMIAVPAANDDGEVTGVVLMNMPYPPKDAFGQAVSLIGGSLVLFTIIVGMIGTIFGFLTAHGLTKRLKSVAGVASSWSQGDFLTFIHDRSGDEIGQLARQLNRMAEQLQNLLQTKEELAALEERNRLARDLHDSVKQQVFATVMQVGAARSLLDEDPGSAKERLAQAQELASQAQVELNAILHELRPTSLQDRGLVQAIRDYALNWSKANDIKVDVRMQEELNLALDVEQAFFRVMQETLSNIARHSEAGQVQIELRWAEEQVSMTITDDGIGFEVESADGKGIGLRSMRERVEALGGSLQVESSPGQGSRLIAELPAGKGEP